MRKIFLTPKFGKGQTLRLVEEQESKRSVFYRWFPVIMLCVGIGLVIAGIVMEIGLLC